MEDLVCKTDVLDDMSDHEKLTQELVAGHEVPQETAGGYTFKLPAERIVDAAKWVKAEQQCCAFIHFSIIVSAGADHLELRLEGGQEIKEFMKQYLPTELRTAPK